MASVEVNYRNELKQTSSLSDVGKPTIQSQIAKGVSVSHKNPSTLKSIVTKKGDLLMNKPQNTKANGTKKVINAQQAEEQVHYLAHSNIVGIWLW